MIEEEEKRVKRMFYEYSFDSMDSKRLTKNDKLELKAILKEEFSF